MFLCDLFTSIYFDKNKQGNEWSLYEDEPKTSSEKMMTDMLLCFTSIASDEITVRLNMFTHQTPHY